MNSDNKFRKNYSFSRRITYTLVAVFVAVIIAGFWNYHLVDGFGKEFIAGNTIGDTSQLADDFELRGGGFGFLFAAIAGLAATFTACNCVVFAMIPGLACSMDQKTGTSSAWDAFYAFLFGVLVVTGVYGFFIGLLGPEAIEVLNERSIRLAQAQAVFSLLGLIMLVWGLLEMEFLNFLKNRLSDITRSFLRQITVKALLLGLLVGFFAIGRPFPVFRQFLQYAADSGNPLYGSAVMMIQGLGQIALMALLFYIVIKLARDKIIALAETKPYKFQMISSIALITGGAYFIYYWGLAFMFDIGGWGFKLGWY